MKSLIKFCLFFVTITSVAFAQDPQLSQYYASPVFTNPAMAGAARKTRIAVAARDQYTALNNNYKTGVLSVDGYIGKVKSGIGFISSYDVAGDGFLTTQTAAAIYSYNVDINRNWAFNAALQGGILQKRYDFSKLIFADQIDPVRGVSKSTAEVKNLDQIIVPNFSSGLVLYNSRLFIGAAVHNLLEPNTSFYSPSSDDVSLRLPRKYTIHGGANIYLNKTRYDEDRIILSPNVLFMQQRNFYQMNLGFYIKQRALTLGAWFRQTSANADAAIFLIGMRFPTVKIGYSYDVIVSSAKTATVGSHEITMVFEIKPKSRGGNRYNTKLRCPEL